MSKSTASLLVLVCLIATVLVTSAQQDMAQFSGTVNINADGTVEPADAPIQRVGDTYTLTGDVGGIGVQRSNIILDGNGHTVSGSIPSATVSLAGGEKRQKTSKKQNNAHPSAPNRLVPLLSAQVFREARA
jgi:hypothetical protein